MTWVVVAALSAVAVLAALTAPTVILLGLRRRVTELEARLNASSDAHDRQEPRENLPLASLDGEGGQFVITGLGADDVAQEPEPVPTVEARLFGDIVLREAVVQAASLAHGVRRALTPESRNRIRFEIKREVKRSRKQRRADVRQARREWEDRQRAGVHLGAEPQPVVSERPEDSAA